MISLFTTINPYSNFDAQSEAISSWNKFKVYSVNIKEEIEMIKDLYPSVEFIETEEITIEGNKKLVKLNGILTAIKTKSRTPFNGIINSDIILASKLNIKSLMKYLKDGSIIVSRYELSENKTQIFPHGFDLFIFKNTYTDVLRNKYMTIGMPWWDFWIPTVLLQSIDNLYLIRDKICFHRTHETNYSYELYIKYGRDFLNSVYEMKASKNINANESFISLFCNEMKKTIDRECVIIKKITLR